MTTPNPFDGIEASPFTQPPPSLAVLARHDLIAEAIKELRRLGELGLVSFPSDSHMERVAGVVVDHLLAQSFGKLAGGIVGTMGPTP